MNQRRSIMRILVPTSTFIAGIFIPIAIDRLTKGTISEHQLTLLALVGSSLSLIVLVIALYEIFTETHSVHKELIGIQKEIVSKVEKSANQFGLLVDFVVETPGENEGVTYDTSRKLIEAAKVSIVFLDAWAQTKDYHLTPTAAEKREAYYEAIIQQVEKHRYSGVQFHRRIIQTAEFGKEKFTLTGGTLFLDYLKKCLKIQNDTPAVSVLRIAPLVINAQIVIIDESYVIWPLLTYDPNAGYITRHGIIIFNDPFQQFVPRIMAIYNKIDGVSRPLEARHLDA